MSESTQHLIVLIVVALCVLFLLFQAFGSYFGRRSALGKCCEKGCDAGAQPARPASVHFLPAEELSKSKRGT